MDSGWWRSPSLRALATRAGVSEGLLRMIRDGERAATPAVVEALAEAFEALSADAFIIPESLEEKL